MIRYDINLQRFFHTLAKVRMVGRTLHLPQGTIRHPQAVALPLVPAYKLGGTEGRRPSLHMDASASILRPLSPYGLPVVSLQPSRVLRSSHYFRDGWNLPPCSLSYSVRQPAPSTSGYRSRVSGCSGGQASCPLRIRHRGTKISIVGIKTV